MWAIQKDPCCDRCTDDKRLGGIKTALVTVEDHELVSDQNQFRGLML